MKKYIQRVKTSQGGGRAWGFSPWISEIYFSKLGFQPPHPLEEEASHRQISN